MSPHTADIWNELEGPRSLRASEQGASQRLARLCFGEGVHEDEPVAGYRPAWRESIEVIAHRGVPVAQIGIYHSKVKVYGSQFRVASIGGVGTHPDYRRLGLGTRLLDHCTRKLTADGARLMLISGTRGLYKRAGCVPAQQFERLTLKPHELQLSMPWVSMRSASAADAGVCAGIYQAEPAHFQRRVEDFVRHLHRAESDGDTGNWIVELGGRPVAYLFAAVPWGRRPEDAVREMVVLGEYAGSRLAVAGGLVQVLSRPDVAELALAVPWWDVDLLQLLKSHGATSHSTPLVGHTMRIVDWPGLMADLTGYIAQRLPQAEGRGLTCDQTGDRYTLSRGQERVELSGAEMTQLVMGMPEGEAKGTALPGGALGATMQALFPLPSFRPGLNSR
jgi:predicted N-acetyltransferase YhbS